MTEVERAGEQLAELAPYFGAICSDLSVYHRIVDVDTIGMQRFTMLVPHLPAYGGAFALSLRIHAERAASAPAAPAAAEGDTPDDVIAERWAQVLREEYPEAYAEGVTEVGADEIVREFAGG